MNFLQGSKLVLVRDLVESIVEIDDANAFGANRQIRERTIHEIHTRPLLLRSFPGGF